MAGKLGGEDRAWRVMLANYDRAEALGTYFPEHTRIYRSDGSVAWKSAGFRLPRPCPS